LLILIFFNIDQIVGVSWAPDSINLASCGLDSCIILWEITNTGLGMVEIFDISTNGFLGQKHKIQTEGAAKGVSWDPAGQFLAYQVHPRHCPFRLGHGLIGCWS
jgi:WD40 repeat protein